MSDDQPIQVEGTGSPIWRQSTRLVVGVLLILLGILLLYLVRQFLIPFILALLLAYLLHPIVLRLQRSTGMSRGLAVAIIFVVIVIVLVAATTGLGIAAANRVAAFGEFLSGVSRDLPDFFKGLFALEYVIGPWTINLGEANLDTFIDGISSAVTPLISQTGVILRGVAGATATFVGTSVLVLVIGFYLLLYLERFGWAIIGWVPGPYKSDASRIMTDAGSIWQSFFRGQLLMGLAVGTMTVVIMSILGLRNSIGLGVLAGVLEFIPIFGPWITAIVSVLVALFQETNPWGLTPVSYALIVLAAGILIQQIENSFLYPRVIGQSLALNPLVVLLAVLAAGSLFGIVGLLLAAPVVATGRLCLGYLYWKTVGVDPPKSTFVKRADGKPSPYRQLADRIRSLRKPAEKADA
ncbi:MAG: AI-2E family transporter [Anaerolineae bacterium]|nr:MAG: AI-2E family transporter [Anaerolineae bacterium]